MHSAIDERFEIPEAPNHSFFARQESLQTLFGKLTDARSSPFEASHYREKKRTALQQGAADRTCRSTIVLLAHPCDILRKNKRFELQDIIDCLGG